MTNIKNKDRSPTIKKKSHSVATDLVQNEASKPGLRVPQVKASPAKKAAEELSRSEEKLRLVMNAALDAVICIDINGDIIFWNLQAEVLFGWPETEVLGKPLAELIIPVQYRKRHNDGMALYLKTGKGPALNRLLELSAIKRSGEEFPIELTIMAIKQEGEEFFCAFVRDITIRKKADKALQVAYDEKNTILESIGDSFFAVDKNWVVTYWNKEAEKMLHTPKSQIIGLNLWEIFPDSIDSESYRKYHQALETSKVIDFEDYYPALDKWFEISASPSVTGLSVYFKDITERKRSETALQKAYEEKNTVLESIDDGFFAMDKDSVVTYWNKRAEILLDTKKEDLIGKNLHEVFIVRGSRIFYDNYVKALKEKITIQFEGFSSLSKKWFAVSAYGSDNGLSVYFKDVTEQKNVAEKIKESELRYRSLIEQATDTICIIDASGKFIEMNPSGCQMFGYSREEILQLFMTDVLFEEDLKKDPIRFDELKAGKTTSNERRIKRKDGTTGEIELSAKMIEDGRIIAFGRDITERKKAGNTLKESELRYRSIIEQATDAICIADASMNIMDINPYGCQMLGYSREEFLQLTVADLLLPEDLKANPFKIEELKLGKIIRNERRFIKKDRTVIEVEMSGRMLEDGRFILFGHDIAERKEAEDKLKESELRYRSLIEQATDTICIVEGSGKFIEMNPSGCRLFGYSKEDILQLSLMDVLFEEDLKTNALKIDELKGGKTINNERRIKRKDGTAVEVELSGKMLEDGRIIIFGRDISARKESEQLIKESEAKYRSFFESSMDGILLTVTDGEILSANPAACEIFKRTEEEICAAGRLGVVDLTDPRLHSLIEERQRTGRAKGELTLLHKDGSKFEAEITSAIFTDSYGRDRTSMILRDITERKEAEDRLKESETKYRTLFEQNMAGVYQTTASGVILNCNAAFAKMLKYDSPAELLKINASELYFSPEDRNDFTDNVINQKNLNNYESVLKCKDGSPLYFIENISHRKDDITGEECFYGIMMDITEKKQAEFGLKESNERYNLISQATNDMVWDWDLVTGKVYRNKEGWKKIFGGREIESEVGFIDDWDSRIHPEDTAKVKEVNEEIQMSEKDFFEVECRMRKDDGTYAYIHDRGYIIRNKQGKAIRLIGATQDITSRKEAELQVAKSELRFRSLVQNSSDLITILDERAYYLFCSPAVKKILGYEPEFIVGKNAFPFLHPDDIATVKAELAKVRLEQYFEVNPCRFKNEKGEWRWLESSVTDMRDNPEVNGFVFNSRDVTERKMAAENLIKTSEELQHALTAQVSLRKKTEDSETRLKEAQATAHLGHWNLNLATQTALWSDEACRIYGLSPEENKQSYATWISFIHPEDLDHVMKLHAESQKTLSDMILSHRIVLKDGTVKYIIAKSKFEFDENGKPVGMHGISHDVTESKIAEEEIKKLSIIAKETGNAVIITNPEGEIVWVNEGFTKITEFEFEEVIGKKPGNFLQGEETNLATVRYMRNKIKNVQPFECDIINYSRLGRKYWLRIQSQPQFDETGKLKYFFAIETDITKEKEAEQILKASEERYRYLFNNNPASIFIWDIEDFQILEVNETAVGLYGYSKEELITKTVFDLSLSEDYNKIKHFASVARQRSEFKSDVSCKHINKAGFEMYMHISSHLIWFKGRPVILALATDITDKIILENELENERQLKQQEITRAVITAQENERQELGSELHDNINQILAGSRLYLGLAKKELKVEHAYLTETESLITSAISEIRILSHSLIAPSLNESELLGAIDNIIEVTEQTSGIKISLQAFDFDETDIPDKLKLSIFRIVQEQFNNILKHAGAQKVIVRLVQENEKTLLSIKDDGVGFDTNKKSSGVGLMNIRTRASLFNGELNIISSPGKGCELRVLFN